MTIAIWQLPRLGVDEALIGDLIKVQKGGRSRAWLWRQVAGATASALAQDVLARPLRTIVAVVLALLLRDLAVRVWAPYEPLIDMGISRTLIDVVSLGRPASLIAVSSTNALMLAPAWFGIGFVVARLSRGAVPIFLAAALALTVTGVTRQLEHAMASDSVQGMFSALLTIFGASIGTFALAVIGGAACGLGTRHDVV
jgi:hypothetical protein